MYRIDAFRASFFGEPSLAIWEGNGLRVHVYQEEHALRLDVEKINGSDGITWDELQSAKDACGFLECDALELYPASRDVINLGNWRHLYIPSEPVKFVRRKT